MKQSFRSIRLMLLGITLCASFLHPVMADLPGARHTLGSCPEPGVSITGASAGSISFAWNAVTGASGYKIWFVRHSDNYTSPVYRTSNTTYSFSGLPSGTYDFYFQTECDSSESASFVIEEVVI